MIVRLAYLLLFSVCSSLRSFWISLNHHQFEPAVRKKFRKSGITIGGDKSWDIHVYDSRFFSKVAFDPSIGIVESYIDGWWDPKDIPAFFNKLITEWSLLTKCNIYTGMISKWRIPFRYFHTTIFNVFSTTEKPPMFCGIKLCVTFLDWATTTTNCNANSSSNSSSSRETPETSDLENNLVHKSNANRMEDMIQTNSACDTNCDRTFSPSMSCNDGSFILEDWHALGFHDVSTVEAWIDNFQKPKLQKQYGDKFYRMWLFYLHGIAAAYRLQKSQHEALENGNNRRNMTKL